MAGPSMRRLSHIQDKMLCGCKSAGYSQTLPNATYLLVRVLLTHQRPPAPSFQDLVIISSQITPVIPRVISRDSGQMKSVMFMA